MNTVYLPTYWDILSVAHQWFVVFRAQIAHVTCEICYWVVHVFGAPDMVWLSEFHAGWFVASTLILHPVALLPSLVLEVFVCLFLCVIFFSRCFSIFYGNGHVVPNTWSYHVFILFSFSISILCISCPCQMLWWRPPWRHLLVRRKRQQPPRLVSDLRERPSVSHHQVWCQLRGFIGALSRLGSSFSSTFSGSRACIERDHQMLFLRLLHVLFFVSLSIR